MPSKLRPLYDKLYIRGEALYNGFAERAGCRRLAEAMPADPRIAEEYRTVFRPFWRRYRVRPPKQFWFRLYCSGDNPVSPCYIPEDCWFRDIVPFYNNLIFAKALQDKCLLERLFPEFRQPETVLRRTAGVYTDPDGALITEAEAAAAVRGRGRVVLKPSVATGKGLGIRFFDSDAADGAALACLLREGGENFIVQKKLSQHTALAALHPDSVNTIRFMTFLHGGRVHVLSAILRVGGAGSEVDNVSRGGYQCTICPDGRLAPTAITKREGVWVRTAGTDEGLLFSDIVVPSFARARELVCRAAAGMGHFRLLGWDIAIDAEGEPVLIEYNVIPGQNQTTCGPTFGDMTETVLEEVYGLRR